MNDRSAIDGAASESGSGPIDASALSPLRRCIAIAVEEFADNHWGKRPLLTCTTELGNGFLDLLDDDAVDELVSRRGLRTPFLRMAREGKVLDAKRFTRSGGVGATVADQAADDRILSQLGDGSTLVLQALHRSWPPLIDFGSALAVELGHPVQINAYITPPENQGFAAHYDVHDVFVLQVSGRKHWRIHEPVLRDPLSDQPWDQRRSDVEARSCEEPIIDAVLEPGDALYLPRGFLHSATALGETSIHLTVGVHPVTRASLVSHLLTAARSEENLRSSLPMGVDLGDPAVLATHLRDTVTALQNWLEAARPDEVAALLDLDLGRAMRAAPLAPLAQLRAADTLTESTPLRLRSGLRVRTKTDDTTVRMSLLDQTVSLPVSAEAAIKTVLTGALFTPSELPELDQQEQLVVARRLIRDGVVVPA